MDIPHKLHNLKLPILSISAFTLLVVSIFYLAPRLLDILSFFWPLLFSTAVFLVAVVVFGQISPSADEDKVGEGLLDFVASEPEHLRSMAEPPQQEEKAEEEEVKG